THVRFTPLSGKNKTYFAVIICAIPGHAALITSIELNR
ncbi:MAG: hypothetical protein ACI9CE_002091, partial [Flavobacterium sp.]